MGHLRIRKNTRYFAVAAALLGTLLFVPGLTPAYGDSAQVSKLLQQAKTSANELRMDSSQMERYSASQLSWKSHANQINRVKEHVNNSGKILANLHEARDAAEPWQQEAIDKITPLLQELASNTTSIIDHLNEGGKTWHPEYEGYVKANAELSADLSRLIGDYIDYGKAKSRTESLGKNLGFSGS